MEDPERDIPTAINLCAGADSADKQIDAFQHFMMPNHSFLHPLCYVPPGPQSLRKVIGVFMFYRAIVWKTKFTIKTCAFDTRTNNLYVDLIQEPRIRLMPFVPAVPMHCHFHLQKVDSLYYIDYHEDILQPKEVIGAIPILCHFGNLWFTFCEYAGLFFAYIFVLLGYWTPEAHLRKAREERLLWLREQVKGVQQTLGVPAFKKS